MSGILFDTNVASPPLRMRYLLEGYEDAWDEARSDMSLPAKHYKFRVRGVDVMGQPTGAEAAVSVFVTEWNFAPLAKDLRTWNDH